ncbi:glycosyl hydrolase family 8 [Pseudooceanicola nanhaiensis]|uniref:glycosyl hydrolase family 8 n=1 Tax=Pseudooceanicola nanhaiensis TaxID=375761 RepID=UPI001CD42B08|nr:glycosyl hydrolase family 8 [Pseudooceanicola nanhaiensis]MCA0922219.1 glycosyl hydrolase family 5 [Pseudooceanicola nanhaiensis]
MAQQIEIRSRIEDVWSAWRDAHMDANGRVIDGPQQNASHSEGQGYGMLLAATAGDRSAFDRMDAWCRFNLEIREDRLMAWRWLPDARIRVPDLNNATDGDLFRAWALLRAAQRFDAPGYMQAARDIVSDLVTRCIAQGPDAQPLLMPAVHGFETTDGFVYNPCYAMPLAMTELARAFDQPRLAAAAKGAVEVSRQLALRGVVPDWVEVTSSGLRAAEGFSFDAGYEAMRIPLYYVWSGLSDHPALLRYTEAQSRVPAGTAAVVIERQTGHPRATSTEAGYRSIAALTSCVVTGQVGAIIPPFDPRAEYYPATLQMFAMIAQAEAAPMCVPI